MEKNTETDLVKEIREIKQMLIMGDAPRLWSVDDIAHWVGLSAFTVEQKVIVREGFPVPITPTGVKGSKRRWFTEEIVQWLRQNRSAIKPIVARPNRRGRPRTKQTNQSLV